MATTAAHLVDNVLPAVPYRQWVISFPKRVRFLMAKHHELLKRVLHACLCKIFAWHKRRARKIGVAAPMTGAVSFCQRFGSLLNLNCNFHSLIPDGVFAYDADDKVLQFVALPSPNSSDIARLLLQIGRMTEKLVARFLADRWDPDDEEDPSESERHWSVFSDTPRPASMPQESISQSELSAFAYGYSLHAARTVARDADEDLERLCRYGARAPVANERLRTDARGRVHVELTKPYFDGRTEIVLSPLSFLRKLAVLIPPPRKHLTRYHGIFAPAHRFRRRVPFVVDDELVSLPGSENEEAHEEATDSSSKRMHSPNRIAWAELLKRVFAVDVLVCDVCGGRMNILAFITNPAVADKILDHLRIEMPRATGPPDLSAQST